jgi:hypothetical protein
MCFSKLCISVFVGAHDLLERNSRFVLFFFGVALLYGGGAEFAQAGSGSYSQACNGVLSLVEGTFGAMVTAVAGIGAILAAAVGGFKMAWSLLVVAIGSFILRSFITLFNGDCGGA